MFHNQRIIKSGYGELSAELNDFRTGSVAFAYSGELIYIGQERPFNNLWVEPGVGNTENTSVAISIWYANAWNAVVDIADGTATGSASLAQAGRISWNTPYNKSWDCMDRSANVSGLADIAADIYDLYWIRMSWTDAMASGTTLKYVGQKFCAETDLTALYPDLRNQALKTAFGGSGKTTWLDEIYAGTDQVINDLKSRQLITAPGQLVDWTLFMEPCAHKTAALIYRGCGNPFRQNMLDATDAYNASMKKDKFRVDTDADGKASIQEKAESTSYLRR